MAMGERGEHLSKLPYSLGVISRIFSWSMRSIFVSFLLFISFPGHAEPYFIHCYDFGCKSRKEIRYEPEQWESLRRVMAAEQADPDQEKQAIRKAIAMMENFSGQIAGTSVDKAGNYPGYDIVKQLDCIDESTNTYQYLSALEELKLFKWHRVEPKQRRIVWFLTHWTAVISEITSGENFAVDSWYRDNGEPPYIQPIEDWRRKKEFPEQYNPD